ncbi:MAG TPA: tetrathionate reductase family octaheme c-type cytochrome [Polyangiaceae bacterium]
MIEKPAGKQPQWVGALKLASLACMVSVAALALASLLVPKIALSEGGARRTVKLPERRSHTDHAGMMKGPFPDGPSVTRACLECHPTAGKEMLHSAHFTWLGKEATIPGAGGAAHATPQRIGKRNLINNFCLSVESNWPRCTNCHAGYGYEDGSYDFGKVDNIDCLICHEQTGTYSKDLAGLPAKNIDLVKVAASVASPTRANCGSCHFAGGGGDAVKHGDLDGSLFFPRERVDVHMGRHGLVCTDCHRTTKHEIPGQSLSVTVSGASRVQCSDCHDATPHRSERLNAHTAAVACPTCHIPLMAVDTPTKMVWDWSTAGQDTAVKDAHRYLKEKGSFVYAERVPPEYHWYDGTGERYLKGDRIDPRKVVNINRPRGSIRDPRARIWPFKVHRGKQPYDVVHRTLVVAKTYGAGGFWNEYDWDKAIRLGSEASGLPYSGSHGFVTTAMYWPLAHMVQPGEKALQCTDCHGEQGRMDWRALGYDSDPADRGGRARLGYTASVARGAP